MILRHRHFQWRSLRRWAGAALLAVAAALLLHLAQGVDWAGVALALRRVPRARLAAAVALSSLSYACYACTDLFAAASFQDQVRRSTAMGIAFVSYAFNQNCGALLGTIGLRLRLYARRGVAAADIARVVGLGFVTNWSGYCLIAGLTFAAGWPALPGRWALGSAGLRAIGIALLLAVAGYAGLCFGARRRAWSVFGFRLELVSGPCALGQIALSCTVWLTCAAAVYVLLPASAVPAEVLGVLLVASIAGLVSHVPGGVGVIEAVFLALLGHKLPRHQLLAGLIAFRAAYYFWPLALAACGFLWLEGRRPGRARQTDMPVRQATPP